jgi:ATP synthase protein I
MQPEDKGKFKEEKQVLNDYGQFTGIAFQMIAIIGIFTFAGYKLDHWLHLKYPIFTISLILLSVVIAIYSIIRSLNKP